LVLQVAPIPTASATAALSLRYRRRIALLPAADGTSMDTLMPAIPEGCQEVLALLCRWAAAHLEIGPQEAAGDLQAADAALKAEILIDQRMGGVQIGRLNGLTQRRSVDLAGQINLEDED
jgi:hypothetical protein